MAMASIDAVCKPPAVITATPMYHGHQHTPRHSTQPSSLQALSYQPSGSDACSSGHARHTTGHLPLSRNMRSHPATVLSAHCWMAAGRSPAITWPYYISCSSHVGSAPQGKATAEGTIDAWTIASTICQGSPCSSCERWHQSSTLFKCRNVSDTAAAAAAAAAAAQLLGHACG
jgi:hypothetical protein